MYMLGNFQNLTNCSELLIPVTGYVWYFYGYLYKKCPFSHTLECLGMSVLFHREFLNILLCIIQLYLPKIAISCRFVHEISLDKGGEACGIIIFIIHKHNNHILADPHWLFSTDISNLSKSLISGSMKPVLVLDTAIRRDLGSSEAGCLAATVQRPLSAENGLLIFCETDEIFWLGFADLWLWSRGRAAYFPFSRSRVWVKSCAPNAGRIVLGADMLASWPCVSQCCSCLRSER